MKYCSFDFQPLQNAETILSSHTIYTETGGGPATAHGPYFADL